MKKGFQRIVALVLCAIFCLSFIGCGKTTTLNQNEDKKNKTSKTDDTKDDTQDESKEVDPFAEHMTISVAFWNVGDAITDNDPVLQAIEKKLNITIEPYPVTWGDYVEKINLWAASGNLPDITAYEAGFTATYDEWTSQGVVRPLPSDLSKYPHVAEQVYNSYGLAVNKVTEVTDNSVFYGIPRPTYYDAASTMLDYGIYLRKDWMKNVGVTKVPENIDELIDLLVKFQSEDPDGNGLNDTIGITGYTFAWISALFSGTAPAAINGFRWVYDADRSLIPVWKSEDFLEAMKNLKKVYDAGVLDPDYIILKGEEGRDKFKNGKAGAYAHCGPELAGLQIMEKSFAETNPGQSIDEILAFVPLWADKNGEVTFPQANIAWSETYIGGHVTDAKAERCVALMDFLLSDEGYKLISLGIEGVDYTEDADGNITLIDRLDAEGNVMSMNDKYPANRFQTLSNWTSYRNSSSPAYSDTIKKMADDYYNDMLARGAKPADIPNTNGLILQDTASLDTAGGDYQKILNDLMTSKNLEDDWNKLVEKLMKNGYDKVIKEVNELYKGLGRN